MCDEESFDEDSSRLVLGPINKQRWTYCCLKRLLDRIIWAYDTDRALQILAGEDDQFDSLVARESEMDRLEPVPSIVAATVYIGARHEEPGPRYRMVWLKAMPPARAAPPEAPAGTVDPASGE